MRKRNKKKWVYLNPFQQTFLRARQPMKMAVAGRGVGKSAAIGVRNRIGLSKLPRAKMFFASTTYNQILTKTLPAIEAMWMNFGLKEYLSKEEPGHYVIGRRPPREFIKPYSPPRNFKNVISFFNGYAIEMLSLDRADLARGGSYDGGDIDEAALIKREHITKVILPSVRGNRHRFSHWMHHQVAQYTSMPWKISGQWVLDYEQKAQAYPDEYFYIETSALDNIEILGKKGIARLKREMTPLEFDIEVMNNRIRKVEDGFYHKFDDEKHCYTPKYQYREGVRGIISEGVKDHDAGALIELSFDFSGWFNGVICFQGDENVEKAFDSFFVKEDRKINELIDDFCEAYKTHKFKFARIWGEPRGWDKNPTGPTIYEQIRERLRKNGWDCEIKAQPTRTTNHIQRHYFMNELLSEEWIPLPKFRISEDKCKDVIIAIQLTQVTVEFKKNKKKEKDREFPQEHAPHFTDMLDYYLHAKHGHKLIGTLHGPGNVVFG